MYFSFSLVTFKAAIQELLTLKPQELRPRSEKVHRELRLEDLMKVSEHFVLPAILRLSHELLSVQIFWDVMLCSWLSGF
jgi:hypothetical protein